MGIEGLSGKSETMTCEGGLSLLMESAADGYAPAQAALGNAYYDGNCTERNYAEAVKWWQKARNRLYLRERGGNRFQKGASVVPEGRRAGRHPRHVRDRRRVRYR